jgi:hypothetical protein
VSQRKGPLYGKHQHASRSELPFRRSSASRHLANELGCTCAPGLESAGIEPFSSGIALLTSSPRDDVASGPRG